jgi:hypothetical protein
MMFNAVPEKTAYVAGFAVQIFAMLNMKDIMLVEESE